MNTSCEALESETINSSFLILNFGRLCTANDRSKRQGLQAFPMMQTVGRRAVAALSRAIGAWLGFRVWHGFQMQTFGGLSGAARGWEGVLGLEVVLEVCGSS